MTTPAALLKNFVLFLLVFGLVSFIYSLSLPADKHGGYVILWLAAMMVLAKFAIPVLILVLVITGFSNGKPTVPRESDSESMFDDNHGPRASSSGAPMRNGYDPSGNAYGTGPREW